jgi:predicted Zn-dependent protease
MEGVKMNNFISARTVFVLFFALCISPAFGLSAGQGDDMIFRAMQDEMQRSISDLVMEDLEQPYFISYTIDDFQELQIKSSLGALTHSKLEHVRYLTVDLRVGDHTLDNSGFKSSFSYGGPNYARITVENDYDAIRNSIYLTTDRRYKEALKSLSKKRAYLQGRIIKNRPDDFLDQAANKYTDEPEEFDIDQGYFEELARAASDVFRDYPMITFSQVRISAAKENQYLMNSAGSKSLRGDRVYSVMLQMSGKNEEGEDISGDDHIVVEDLTDLSDKDGFVQWAKKNAEKMKSLIAGAELEEYAGPVIFVGDGTGEFFRQLFAKNISNTPPPIYDNEQMAEMMPKPEFGNKVKRRVLPAFFDVYDDPTVDKIDGMKLVGDYGVDDAGNAPVRVQLVEKGKLVNLLIGTAPTKKIKEPNGHARGSVGGDVVARPGNLFFESSDQAPYGELVKSMLELCEDIDLEYGLVIRRLGDPNAPAGGMRYFFGQGGARIPTLTAPIEAYKLYPDGREEPVRNLEFSNVTVRILRDILQTSDEQHVYNYLIGNDFEMPASIVCPAILVEEMELKKSEEKVTKPPILPSPLAKQ